MPAAVAALHAFTLDTPQAESVRSAGCIASRLGAVKRAWEGSIVEGLPPPHSLRVESLQWRSAYSSCAISYRRLGIPNRAAMAALRCSVPAAASAIAALSVRPAVRSVAPRGLLSAAARPVAASLGAGAVSFAGLGWGGAAGAVRAASSEDGGPTVRGHTLPPRAPPGSVAQDVFEAAAARARAKREARGATPTPQKPVFPEWLEPHKVDGKWCETCAAQTLMRALSAATGTGVTPAPPSVCPVLAPGLLQLTIAQASIPPPRVACPVCLAPPPAASATATSCDVDCGCDCRREPKLSRRKAAMARKRAILEGNYGAWDPETGLGWDPAWDRMRKVVVMKPPKGRKHDREQPRRLQRVAEGLAAQERLQADYRKDVEARKPVKGLMQFLKKQSWEKE